MPRNRRLRRGIYLLPSIFTVGNLLCGFSSLVWASMGFLGWAAFLIIVAGILDMLDGRVARGFVELPMGDEAVGPRKARACGREG